MAGKVLQELAIIFSADVDKLSKGLEEAQKGVEETTSSIKGASVKLGEFASQMRKSIAVLASFAAVRKAWDTSKTALNEYFKAAEQEGKLAKVMQNTMSARDADIQSIVDLTDAQERLGVVSGEAQTAGAQELATYLTYTETLKKLIPTLNDMAAQQLGIGAAAESVVPIATMLGKVMNGQVSALSRYGYTFDLAQERILMYGTEAERAAVLVDVVSESVGGMNEALGGTLQGSLEQLNGTLGKSSEMLGAAFAPAITAVLPPIKALASALLYVTTCMAKFSQWFFRLFGVNASVAKSADSVAESSLDAGDAIEKQGGSAKKASKETKKLLSTLDELNEVNKETEKGGSGGGGADINDISAGAAGIGDILDDLESAEASIGELVVGAIAWAAVIAGAVKTLSPVFSTVSKVFSKAKKVADGIGSAAEAAGDVASVAGDVAETASSMANTAANTAQAAALAAETAATNASAAANGLNATMEGLSALTGIADGLGSVAQAIGLAAVGLAASSTASKIATLTDNAANAKTAIEAIDDNAVSVMDAISVSVDTVKFDNLDTKIADTKHNLDGLGDNVPDVMRIMAENIQNSGIQMLIEKVQEARYRLDTLDDTIPDVMANIASTTQNNGMQELISKVQAARYALDTLDDTIPEVMANVASSAQNNGMQALEERANAAKISLDAIGDDIPAVMDRIKAVITKSMDSATSAVNTLCRVLHSIPADVSTRVTITQVITKYATGAVVGGSSGGSFGGGGSSGGGGGRAFATGTITSGPQEAIIGEDGTEAVVPLEGHHAKNFARRYPWLIGQFERIWGTAGMRKMADGGLGGIGSLRQGYVGVDSAGADNIADAIVSAMMRVNAQPQLMNSSIDSSQKEVMLSVDGYSLALTVINAMRSYEQVTGLQLLTK